MSRVERERKPFPPRWAFFVLALMIIAGITWNAYLLLSANAEKNTAQANSQTLAQDIQKICDTQGKLLVQDRDLCAKADQIQENPAQAIAGPKGESGNAGKDGIDGKDGAAGPAGAKGDKGDVGVAGSSGTNGTNGATGAAGPPGDQGAAGLTGSQGEPGPAGADGIGEPGPAGPQGEPGPAGANGVDGQDGADGIDGRNGTNGTSPSSFTFTDKTGTKYTCTPNPAGSSTYTCEASGGKLP